MLTTYFVLLFHCIDLYITQKFSVKTDDVLPHSSQIIDIPCGCFSIVLEDDRSKGNGGLKQAKHGNSFAKVGIFILVIHAGGNAIQIIHATKNPE